MVVRSSAADAVSSFDLIEAARMGLEHAKIRRDLVAKKVMLPDFQSPTEYQIYETERLSKDFITRLIKEYLVIIASIDALIIIDSDEVFLNNDDNSLINFALARATEHWITKSLERRLDPARDLLAITSNLNELDLMIELLRSASIGIDDSGSPVLTFDDVDYRLLERLIWKLAAEIRHSVSEQTSGVDEADRILTVAAKRLLGPRRRRSTTPAERLAERLLQTDMSLSSLLLAALEQAQPRLFCALLAGRLGLSTAFVFPALSQPERLALLLKAAGLSDKETIKLIFELSTPLQIEQKRIMDIADGCRALRASSTEEMVRQMKLHPLYRQAISLRENAL